MPQQTVSWITGASSGIGEAVAIEMASRGYLLILSARREDELQRVKAICVSAGANSQNIYVLPLDVTDIESMPAKVTQANAAFGTLDLLFNNAGISQRATCLETDLATYRKIFEVDVFGQIALTKLVLPLMIEQGSGHISVTASVAGKIGVSKRTGYCAAKHAVMGFFDSLRAELSPHNIHVSTVVPGFIRTNLSTNALKGDGSNFGVMDDDISAGMPVDRAAKVIVNGLESKRMEINVGEGKEMLALTLKRLLPNLLFKVVAKRASDEQNEAN